MYPTAIIVLAALAKTHCDRGFTYNEPALSSVVQISTTVEHTLELGSRQAITSVGAVDGVDNLSTAIGAFESEKFVRRPSKDAENGQQFSL
jgi:hypothetical protein